MKVWSRRQAPHSELLLGISCPGKGRRQTTLKSSAVSCRQRLLKQVNG